MNRLKKFVLTVFLATTTSIAQAQLPTSADELNSYRLAKLFFAGRAAIGERSSFTDDPTDPKNDKAALVESIRLSYERLAGEKFDENVSPELKALWSATTKVLDNAMKGEYKGRWKDHPNFPGKLIPARFGNLVTTEYNAITKGKSQLRWTTSDEYLVNAASRADSWEQNAMKSQFKSPTWQQGHAYFELVKSGEQSTYRYALPEYFKTSCMNCHGGDMGKIIHQGKSAAGSGTFGGILSVQLKK